MQLEEQKRYDQNNSHSCVELKKILSIFFLGDTNIGQIYLAFLSVGSLVPKTRVEGVAVRAKAVRIYRPQGMMCQPGAGGHAHVWLVGT